MLSYDKKYNGNQVFKRVKAEDASLISECFMHFN